MDLQTIGGSWRTHNPSATHPALVAALAALALTLCGLLLAPPTASAAGTGSIKGTVTNASTAEPIKGAEVCAYEVGVEEHEPECASTESSGEYTIKELAAGEYKVVFFADLGGLNFVTQFYKDQLTFAGAEPIKVTLGSPFTGIDAAMEEGGETITGTVSDASNHATIEEVVVCALEKDAPKYVACALTGAGGEYVVAGLPAGEYKVLFLAEYENSGYVDQYYNDKSTFSQADPVSTGASGMHPGIDAQMVRVSSLWPASAGAPQLSGTPVPGNTLFCSSGLWINSPTSYSYKWLRDGVPVAGQTSSTYGVQGTDVGQVMACQVTAINDRGSGTAISNALQVQVQAVAIPPAVPSRKKCKKGFKKKTVHGRQRCVRVKKPKKHRHR
ncbi:MAG TPA: carboxypeptidase regulatory-like domain-containing protein [Solirubrobacterales bacterium]|nr:carboxypeptidase regulatory-like domain-containing protein [Solirubrobacterales bacterium]